MKNIQKIAKEIINSNHWHDYGGKSPVTVTQGKHISLKIFNSLKKRIKFWPTDEASIMEVLEDYSLFKAMVDQGHLIEKSNNEYILSTDKPLF